MKNGHGDTSLSRKFRCPTRGRTRKVLCEPDPHTSNSARRLRTAQWHVSTTLPCTKTVPLYLACGNAGPRNASARPVVIIPKLPPSIRYLFAYTAAAPSHRVLDTGRRHSGRRLQDPNSLSIPCPQWPRHSPAPDRLSTPNAGAAR